VGQHTKTVIDHASAEMVQNLNIAGESISQITGAAFKKFSTAQEQFDTTLNRFSNDMNGHLDRMATELESIGQNAKSLIDQSAENLASTLGDIDHKLLNTAVVLKESLEAFRTEYEASLTQYLDGQQQRLDGFLDKQNDQLEQTIGKQRQGLEDVTQQLKQQFEQMVKQQDQLNKMYGSQVQRLDMLQQAALPKIANIAHDLATGERQFAQRIDHASEHLAKINQALSVIPNEIHKSYEKLNEKYVGAFNQLDGGVHDVASKLVAASDVLMQTLNVHQIVNKSR
jgi:DNA anti-recombination protein RmuC